MSESFEKMSVIELRQKAKEMGVKLGAGINKQGIVEKLKEAAKAAVASAEPQASAAPEPAPAEAAAPRPIRSAAIITDDEEMEDEDDVPVLTPNPAMRAMDRGPSRSAPGMSANPPAASSLSTISAKAPAFTMEGSRAWHNPRTYQAQPSGYQRPASGSWQRPAQPGPQDQRGYTRSDPRMQQRPQQQTYVNRFGPEQPQQDTEPYRGYGTPMQQDYTGAPANPGYNQSGYGYAQPNYQTHREQPANPGLSEILAAGDCFDGEGVLEVHPDGYGFLRTNHYLSGKQDVYISNAQIRRFSLRTGDYITGKVRPQRESDRYSAMLYITEINGALPDEMPNRPRFDELTPIYPKKRMTLSGKKENDPVLRLIDLLSPIGFGQRAMLCCSSRLDRLALIKKLAAHISKNHGKAHLMTLLLDQRPEDVTELADSVECDLAYANFDESPENQVRAAELALERAMRLTEQKEDVVLLVDSLTRLASACNAVAPANARTLNNGLAAGALNKPKRFFGAARNTREGGSLTIIATMLTDTGSDLDAAICQSFEGNGNMTCVLRQQGANQPILMQLDKCVTVHDEWLLSEKEQAIAQKLRETVKDLSAAEAMNAVLPLFAQAETNDALEALLNV